MARTGRDEVQDQVRRQLQEAMNAAGVAQGRVALEVLFWLPAEFVREYQDLFMRALHLGDGDDKEKAGEDQGRIKKYGKERDQVKNSKRDEDGELVAGTVRGARGGKRYRTDWIVKDERAMEVKRRVDNVLRELVRREGGKVMRQSQGSGGGNLVEVPQGLNSGEFEIVGKGKKMRKKCRECGKFAAHDWARCPYPHA